MSTESLLGGKDDTQISLLSSTEYTVEKCYIQRGIQRGIGGGTLKQM